MFVLVPLATSLFKRLTPAAFIGLATAFAFSGLSPRANAQGIETPGLSEAQSVNVAGTGLLEDEAFGILPEVGALAFKDANNSLASRGAIGLALDFNLARLQPGTGRLYAGVSTGALYSHVGGPDANFFGYNSTITPGAPGAAGSSLSDVVLIPADVKLGYDVSDRFRISLHGGANAIYNSQPGSIQFGQLGGGGHWNAFPNAGADLDFGLARNVALGVRPDFTFTPGSDFFMGTLQLGYVFG